MIGIGSLTTMTLMATIPMFNPAQQTSSLMLGENVTPGTYQLKIHANTNIKEIKSDYGKCASEGQNALCEITIDENVNNKEIISTVFLGEREDGKYILDYSSSDEAIRPSVNGGIVNYPENIEDNKKNTEGKVTSEKNINNKKTGLNLFILLIMFLTIVAGVVLYNRKIEDNK